LVTAPLVDEGLVWVSYVVLFAVRFAFSVFTASAAIVDAFDVASGYGPASPLRCDGLWIVTPGWLAVHFDKLPDSYARLFIRSFPLFIRELVKEGFHQ
jgi:hypothetical protein